MSPPISFLQVGFLYSQLLPLRQLEKCLCEYFMQFLVVSAIEAKYVPGVSNVIGIGYSIAIMMEEHSWCTDILRQIGITLKTHGKESDPQKQIGIILKTHGKESDPKSVVMIRDLIPFHVFLMLFQFVSKYL